MKARLVRIGNSRGVRLPKLLIEEAGLAEEVSLRVRGETIVIASASSARSGWSEAAERAHESDDDRLLDAETGTRFDDVEWRW